MNDENKLQLQDKLKVKVNENNNIENSESLILKPIPTIDDNLILIYNFELKLKKLTIEYKNSFTFKLYWKTKSNIQNNYIILKHYI